MFPLSFEIDVKTENLDIINAALLAARFRIRSRDQWTPHPWLRSRLPYAKSACFNLLRSAAAPRPLAQPKPPFQPITIATKPDKHG